MQLSPEFDLAVQCCRAGFAGPSSDPVAVSRGDLDWTAFVDVVRFHRVEALAWQTLAGTIVPDRVRDELSMAATKIATQNLRTAAECVRLNDRFAVAGIPLLFLKGATLGALAYDNPALKASIDIDLLIDPGNLRAAADLLRESGYRQLVPASDRALVDWHRRSKESVWAKTDQAFQIDLHTRPADNRQLIPSINAHSPSQLVDVGNGRLIPTLAADELFAYLAVHGGTSSWFRLKWLSDFAGFLHSKEPAEIARLYRRSQELVAGRTAAQGLLLADQLFGTLAENSALRVELLQDRYTRRLVQISLALLTRVPSEPTERFLGTLPLHLTPFLLMPGWRYKMSELSVQAGGLLNRFGS